MLFTERVRESELYSLSENTERLKILKCMLYMFFMGMQLGVSLNWKYKH